MASIDGTLDCPADAKTVLIVEDNPTNLKLVDALVRHRGYRTIHSIDGQDVISMVREHRPDLILMDIQLPNILGTDLAQELKADEDLRSIPIMAVTASAMRGDEERIRASGCDEYIAKPIDVIAFGKLVDRLLA